MTVILTTVGALYLMAGIFLARIFTYTVFTPLEWGWIQEATGEEGDTTEDRRAVREVMQGIVDRAHGKVMLFILITLGWPAPAFLAWRERRR